MTLKLTGTENVKIPEDTFDTFVVKLSPVENGEMSTCYVRPVKKETTSVLQYRYHGWTYLLDGTLRRVPQFNKVDKNI